MKVFPAQIVSLWSHRPALRSLRVLSTYLIVLAGVIVLYTVLFHELMALEGREYSWLSGLYWTLTVMSTLGFGDITFESDLGRTFSILVLASGTVFLLILLPFIIIQFFWAPWIEAQDAARAPRELPRDMSGHVLLTHYDGVSAALIGRLDRHRTPYALLVPDRQEAVRLHDRGFRVLVGELDDPTTYERARVRQAALVATTCNDFINSNVAFTVRSVSADVRILATAEDPASVDVLELAGCTHVLELSEMLGHALAGRTIGGDAMSHTVGELGPLVVAEATAARTPLVGQTLAEGRIREKTGVNVVGIWERGSFVSAQSEHRITSHSVLVLAGTREQLYRYDELFVIYNVSGSPVVILGGGRVGQATGRALAARDVEYRIVERDPSALKDPEHHVLGSAAELEVLEKAGIMETPAVIITTNDDALNVYLTIYCRKLRPDVQIITRATFERNTANLHRAGTDFVMSTASMGANTALNLLQRSEILMLAEGLDLFKLPVPPSLQGRVLSDCAVRERSGASIVAIVRNEEMQVNPDASTILPGDAELVLIGSLDAQSRFLDRFAGS